MKEIIRSSVKTALTFAVIGAIVSTVLPFIMTGLASAGLVGSVGSMGALTTAGVAHTTLVFAIFGGLEPFVKPVFNFAFGENKQVAAPVHDGVAVAAKTMDCPDQTVVIANTQLNSNVDIEAKAKIYTQLLEGQKSVNPEQTMVRS